MLKTFRQQFDKSEKLNLYEDETLSFRDIQPEKLKTEIPVLFLKAWGTTPENYKDSMIGLAEKGRRVLAIDNIYGISPKHIRNVKEARELIPDELLLSKVAATLKILEVKDGFDQIDVVAHSEGAIHAIFAALLRPEKFRNLLLVNPAGMVGEDNRGRVIKAGTIEIAQQIGRLYKREGILSTVRKTARDAMSFKKAIFAGPKKIWDSIGTISKTQINERLEVLNDLGIKISIIHGTDDRVYSVGDVKKMTKSGTVHKFYPTETAHNEIYLNPKPFNTLIDSSLDLLETLHRKTIITLT